MGTEMPQTDTAANATHMRALHDITIKYMLLRQSDRHPLNSLLASERLSQYRV